MKKYWKTAGFLEVDMLITPDFGEDINRFEPSFKGYNLVIINYGGATWKESVRKAFEKYVSDGGGVVVLHSSIIPMEDWPAYKRDDRTGRLERTRRALGAVRLLERRAIRLRLLPPDMLATTGCNTRPSLIPAHRDIPSCKAFRRAGNTSRTKSTPNCGVRDATWKSFPPSKRTAATSQ